MVVTIYTTNTEDDKELDDVTEVTVKEKLTVFYDSNRKILGVFNNEQLVGWSVDNSDEDGNDIGLIMKMEMM